MAGLGQSSVPSSDQSTPWNSSQFNMGRSGSIDNHSSIQSKYYAMSDKRTFSDQRLIPEENGVLSQNMFNQFNRQQTGFQSSNIMSNEKSYVSNIPTNMTISSGNNAMNYNMYQRNISDSGLYQPPNMDLSSQSKQGFNSNSRMSNMPQYMENSLSSHAYLSPTPHRTISSGNMNPNVPIYNGQNMSSKNRSGSYNFESNSASLVTQWDSPIGNFDSTDFPILHKPKVNPQLSQMSGNYNYSLSSKTGQINYQQMVMKPTITPGEHSNEFSIQQEDFPALPVAQNPVSSTEAQRSSSATGNSAAAFTGSDVISQSHSSSNTLRSAGFDSMEPQKFHNSYYDLPMHDLSTHIQPASSVSSSISSSNNSSQPSKPVPKKIVQGPNNYITNIPNDMVNDAFGLIGLVKLIGINDTHENLNLLAPGLDTLSLNRELSSNREIYHSYVSPLNSNCAGRPHDMDYAVPKEYRIRHSILDKLADPLPEKLSDETLFWIFYNLTGEECQTTAAKQLMARQWRYNKREKFWLTRDSKGVNEPTVHPNLERGSYIVWDYEKAQRVSKILTVYYKDLENVTPATTKPLFPFCYNSPFIKRSAVNSSAIPPPPQLPSTGRTNPKNLATFLQNPSATVSVETRLLNNPISQNFSQPDQMMTSTTSQIRVQINNHAPAPPPPPLLLPPGAGGAGGAGAVAAAIVVSQQQQQSQSTQ